jgi:hypothetical protein
MAAAAAWTPTRRLRFSQGIGRQDTLRRGWDCEIDFDQGRVRPDRECCAPFEGKRSMTTETILIVGAITAAFAVFALALWRAERLTRDLKRE